MEIFHRQLKIAVDSGHISLRRDQLDAIFLNWCVREGGREGREGGREGRGGEGRGGGRGGGVFCWYAWYVKEE